MAKAKPIKGVRDDTALLLAGERMIETRLSEMLAYESYVSDQEAVTELHQMRIAAKRLRYTLEIFQDAYDAYSGFGPQIRIAAGEIEQIQENLGAIHDADVLMPKLNEYLCHLLKQGYGKDRWGSPVIGVHCVDYDACLGLIEVCERLRTEREKQYDRFLDHWLGLLARDLFKNLRSQLKHAAQEASHNESHPDSAQNGANCAAQDSDRDSRSAASARASGSKRAAGAGSRTATRKSAGVKSTRRLTGRA